MQFSQVLDYLIVGLPFVFCALFVIDFTNGLFVVWDKAAPRLTVIEPEQVEMSVLPASVTTEICLTPPPPTGLAVAPANPTHDVKPEATEVAPILVEKRKRGRSKGSKKVAY